ncbi:4-hydroxybenzoyl-CoA reductase subunit beta [Burkholderiales bacterium]|nr:4-hydroxybenzoyl-CoA reductase subunit beta [Burkholderiales bacterium]
MERLPAFELRRASSLAEAIGWLAGTPGARAIAGGTDLVPNLRDGLGSPPVLVDLSGIAGLDALVAGDDGVRIGANVTLARLASDAALAQALPAVVQAAASIAAPGHRSVATVGGNLCVDTRCVYYNQSEWWRRSNDYCLKHGGDTCHVAPHGERCHAAYAGDLAPALIVCGARVEIAGPDGTRGIAIEDLYRDDGRAHLALGPGELVAGVVVPVQPPRARSAYRKARARGAIDFPLAGVAVRLSADAGRVASLAVGLTGTNSRPLRLAGTDAWSGRAIDEALLADLGKAVQKQVSPMRTTLTQANWRRQVAAVAAQRLVRELAEAIA